MTTPKNKPPTYAQLISALKQLQQDTSSSNIKLRKEVKRIEKSNGKP